MSVMEYLTPELSSPELDSSLEERRSSVSPTNSGGEEVESPPRATRVHSHKIRITLDGKQIEFEKPPHSYIALISKAILSSPQKKMLLGDIYQYIMDNYPYYSYLGDKSWRNSIRHNLSLNECFIKDGRADNGKGNFWAIHSACFEDFSKGDFRRRQARRRARRSQMPANQLPVNQLPVTYAYNMGYVPMTQMPVSMGFSRQYHHHHHPYAAAAAAAASAPTYIPSSRRHYVQQQYHAQQQLYHQASNAAYAHAAATAAAAAVMTTPGSPSPVSSVMTTPQIHPSWLGASGIQALREALGGIAPVYQSQS